MSELKKKIVDKNGFMILSFFVTLTLNISVNHHQRIKIKLQHFQYYRIRGSLGSIIIFSRLAYLHMAICFVFFLIQFPFLKYIFFQEISAL